jgi:hypothetical protein
MAERQSRAALCENSWVPDVPKGKGHSSAREHAVSNSAQNSPFENAMLADHRTDRGFYR